MSSFNCEHCGKPILDSEDGYVTECKHYPLEKLDQTLTTTESVIEYLINKNVDKYK